MAEIVRSSSFRTLVLWARARHDDLVKHSVLVYGAYGHTGRFVVAELIDRGFVPVVAGRDPDKLAAFPELERRPASVDDPASLDRALAGADAVINCAGPFALTAAPVIEAAARAGIPYVDVAAEIEANVDTFSSGASDALVVPAMAFFGGLGDLLATAAMGDWAEADEVQVAYGLDHWHPTAGTRAAGKVSRDRRGGRRVRFSGGTLEYRDDALPAPEEWTFPEPTGSRKVVPEFSMADIVTVPSHLSVPSVRTYMTVEAARDVAAPETPAPSSSGPSSSGPSEQRFVVDVVVHRNGQTRRALAHGRDIYAVSAPLAVLAVERILAGRAKVAGGVASAGAAFDAREFLDALAPVILTDLGKPSP
jgi:NAD(P)-dependent dehydrogenase (short-subunit alcohol dehydrogenase family)